MVGVKNRAFVTGNLSWTRTCFLQRKSKHTFVTLPRSQGDQHVHLHTHTHTHIHTYTHTHIHTHSYRNSGATRLHYPTIPLAKLCCITNSTALQNRNLQCTCTYLYASNYMFILYIHVHIHVYSHPLRSKRNKL